MIRYGRRAHAGTDARESERSDESIRHEFELSHLPGARQSALAGRGFEGDDKHTHHSQSAVLEFSRLEAELLGRIRVGDVAERVERATRVHALVLVELRGARDFEVAHGEHFDHRKGGDGQAREREAQVLRLLEFNLAGVHPGDARRGFRRGGADEAEHGPAGVEELAFAEAHDVERFVIRL